MRTVLLSTVVLLTVAFMANAYEWRAYNGHSYALTQPNLNWVTAEAEAVAAGGHLVTINDAAENEWIVNTFAGSTLGAAWIGYYLDSDSQWKWISAEPVTYTNYYLAMWPQGGVHAYIHTWDAQDHADVAGTWNANPDSDLIAPPWGSPVPSPYIYRARTFEPPDEDFCKNSGIGQRWSACIRRRVISETVCSAGN